MKRILFFAFVCGCILPEAQAAGLPFSIVIEEEAGLARRAEAVAVSLPFAEGVLKTPEVRITDAAGRAVQAQFEVLGRWDDHSIRWLLARFFVDVPARGRVVLTAIPGQSSAAQGPALAQVDGRHVTVATGLLRARLGADAKDSFMVTDTSGRPLLRQRPSLVVYTGDGQAHRSGLPDTIDLEVNGPLYASVFVAGPMETAGNSIFRYETRLHFWRGKPEILAEHTVVGVGGPPVTVVDGIVVHLAADPLEEVVLGGASGQHKPTLPAAGPVRLTQECAFWQECLGGWPSKYVVLEADFSYTLEAGNSRIAEGERAPGWLWVANQERSLGFAVRDFWEEGPKGLSVARDGQVAIECYQYWQPKPGEPRPKREPTPDFGADPRLADWFASEGEETVKRFLTDTGWEGPVRRGPMRFGRTRAKTTDVRYLFGVPGQRDREIEVLAAQRTPLVAIVDPDYLCHTRAFLGVEVSASQSRLPIFENALVSAFRNFEQKSIVYGFLHFGDNQCGIGYNNTVPSTFDVTEYDTIRCLLMQFCRTGIADYFRQANQAARHYADVDQDQVTGAVRFHGYRPTGEYHEEAHAYDMGGHIYIEGIVAHYALTGDRRSRRCFLRVGEALKDYAPQDCKEVVLKQDERSLTRPAIALLGIYDLTRDRRHLAPATRMVRGFNAASGDLFAEMAGQDPFRTWWLYHGDFVNHVLEVLARYHMATGDSTTLHTLRKSLDLLVRDHWNPMGEGLQMMDNLPFSAPVSNRPAHSQVYRPDDGWIQRYGLAFAYAARVTGDTRYLAPILDVLETLGQGWEDRCGNRQFALGQLWAIPAISLLPPDWKEIQEIVVRQEVLRASLSQADQLSAWSPEGSIRPEIHGRLFWADSPWGPTLRTHGTSWVSYESPRDILLLPGTLSVWVKKEPSTWGRKPWPWYSEIRGLVHIAGERPQTDALDVMVGTGKVWVRLYDPRSWEMTAISAPSRWDDGGWHHIAVVWNRCSLTLYLDGEQAARDETIHLPGGGQETIHLGWRPGNWYGQAGFHDLRLFRTPLTPERIRRVFREQSK